MSENDQILLHERLKGLEINLSNTIETVKKLADVVDKQGIRLTRAIIVAIIVLSIGVLLNGGTQSFIQTIQNMAKIFG